MCTEKSVLNIFLIFFFTGGGVLVGVPPPIFLLLGTAKQCPSKVFCLKFLLCFEATQVNKYKYELTSTSSVSRLFPK